MPEYGLHGWHETPDVADPTNAVYHKVCRRLLQPWLHRAADVGIQPWQLQRLWSFNEEHLADVAEAALAAANAAADREQRLERTWRGLRGGAWGKADRVTAFLHAEIHGAFGPPPPPSPPPPPPPPPPPAPTPTATSPLPVGSYHQVLNIIIIIIIIMIDNYIICYYYYYVLLYCQVHCSWAACGHGYLPLSVGMTVRVLPPPVDCQGWVYVGEAVHLENLQGWVYPMRGWAPPSYMAPDIREF